MRPKDKNFSLSRLRSKAGVLVWLDKSDEKIANVHGAGETVGASMLSALISKVN